jgi:hypothetical protein
VKKKGLSNLTTLLCEKKTIKMRAKSKESILKIIRKFTYRSVKNQAKELNNFLKESPANEKIKVDLDFLKNQTT